MGLELVGKEGRVVSDIGGRITAGEVMVDLPRGGSQVFPAFAFDAKELIRRGNQVWIEEQNGRVLYVTTR